jgi:hypothetical protein
MRLTALMMFAWLGMGIAINGYAADDYDLFSGVSLASVRSTQGEAKNYSAGITGIYSVRYLDKYYGFEIQGGYFGKSGPYTSNVEADLTAIGLLPLWHSGISLYGKVGAAEVISSTLTTNTGLTYGAGAEFLFNRTVVRLGYQHFDVGNNSLPHPVAANLVGVTVLVK